MTRILGLDMSLASTGYAVLADDRLYAEGSFKTALRGMERLTNISDRVLQLARNYQPSLVAIEGYSMGSRGDAITKLAELGGIIRYRLALEGFPYVEIPPGTWKKAVLGKGNLAKDQVALQIYKKYGLEFDTQDAADAFGVAMCAHLQSKAVAA